MKAVSTVSVSNSVDVLGVAGCVPARPGVRVPRAGSVRVQVARERDPTGAV